MLSLKTDGGIASVERARETKIRALAVVRPTIDGKSANAESRARIAIEEIHGYQINEAEWTRQKRNLVEFIATLARWERERRTGAGEREVMQ